MKKFIKIEAKQASDLAGWGNVGYGTDDFYIEVKLKNNKKLNVQYTYYFLDDEVISKVLDILRWKDGYDSRYDIEDVIKILIGAGMLKVFDETRIRSI